MHNKLNQLLDKRGIKDVSELDEYEKRDFDRYNKILSKGSISVKKIEEFCINQIQIIEGKWKDLDNSKEKNDKLITFHVVYKSLLELIKAPSTEKENLERYLNSLIE